METDDAAPSTSADADKAAADKAAAEKLAAEKALDVGPYALENPARVVPAQAKFVSFKADSR
jgi:hypothetical protein